MTNKKPTDLTEIQWMLLKQLSNYKFRFYTDFVYIDLYKDKTDVVLFCCMFFRLAALGYTQLDSFGEMIPGYKREAFYVLSSKGRWAVAQYVKTTSTEDFTIPLDEEDKEFYSASYLATTVKLKDYLLHH